MFKYFLAAFILLFTGSAGAVHAESTEHAVSSNKKWKVEFNTPVTLESAKQAVSVKNTETGKEIAIKVRNQDEESIVAIEPPEEGYTYESTYNLEISDEIVSVQGIQAENTFSKKFTVKEDPFGSWHSVRTFDMANETTVHLLADEPAPELTNDVSDMFDEYDASFKLGLDTSTGKKIMDFPIEKNISFLRNERENIDSLFRKIDDQVFIYSERADSSLTEDFAFYVTDEDIKSISFSFEDGADSNSILNTLGEFKSQKENRYLQSTFNNAFGKTLHSVYEFDEHTHTMEETSELTQGEVRQQAERNYQNINRIFYDDLSAYERGEFETRDFSRIRSDLSTYATGEMLNGLEDAYYSVCTGCEAWFMSSDWSWEIHQNTLENTSERIIVEAAERENMLTSGGFDLLTLRKENEVWKLHDLGGSSFSELRHLSLKREEAKTVLSNHLNTSEEQINFSGTSSDNVWVGEGENFETTTYHFVYNGNEYKVKSATGNVAQVYE
ncbi:Ig-like domain-containing protein [Salimicrobium flavidum]|uniref:SbsA Ig-like domain-containing protein n=1 Tax=Salimicrobium flavidum TaxID=570947 RepID=A0A1N7IZQ8_9BACI|nr:Ig-like domain-containing protein [Salimicrobium flavidum]SIS42622.1 hypothetical protein SAMN05421687_10378 [Salimicrobium flavidum]